MSNDFNLMTSVDYTVFKKNFVEFTAPGQFSLVKKSYVPLLPRIVGKFIHWILYPNQRISAVRDAFSRTQAEGKPLLEQLNHYVHLRNFNELIDQHNRTSLFWTHVALLDLSPFEEKIRQSLTRHVNYSVETKSITDHAGEIGAARKVLQSVKCPDKLSLNLAVLHTQVDTTCQMQERLLIARIYKELHQLADLPQWDLSHVKLFHKELPAVIKALAEGNNLWKLVAARHADMLKAAQEKTDAAVQKELTAIKGQIDPLKAKIDNPPAREKVDKLCEQIDALPDFKKQLEVLGQFLPKEGVVREKMNATLENYEFLKKLAAIYPAHKQALDKFLQAAAEELKVREAAHEKYGDIGVSLLFFHDTEFLTFIRNTYKQHHHPFYIDILSETSELSSVQNLCQDAKDLLALRKNASEIEKMEPEARARYLTRLDELLKENHRNYLRSNVPKLTAKYQALREELRLAWEPFRPKTT